MSSFSYSLIYLITFLIVFIFLNYRLSFFSREKISGRLPFIFGGLFLLVAFSWQAVSRLEVYDSWFLDSVYPVLDVVLFLFYLFGTLLITVGLALYTDYWQDKNEELTIREQKLSIVNNLQKDARQPYQLMELLNLTIKEIVAHIPETCGAVFLINRSQRRLVLASTAGLNKHETALLERYPLGQNNITQAIEFNEALCSGYFDFLDSSEEKKESRFKSNLVLPMVSGDDKIGCISLFSEKKGHFSKSDINYLMPLAEWLAEKIRSAKLQKDLSGAIQSAEMLKNRQNEFRQVLVKASDAFNKEDITSSFCSSIVGFLDNQSVHLYGLKNGLLNFYGGSEPLLDLSENYKTALIDALDRGKPLILNQEGQNSEGKKFIARSTFIYPLSDRAESSAIMFVSDKAFGKIDEDDFKILSVYADFAELALKQSLIKQLSLTRRKGFDKVLTLLNIDQKSSFEKDPGFFMNHLSGIMPPNTISLTFIKNKNGSFKVREGHVSQDGLLDEFDVHPGEGVIGEMNSDLKARFLYGRSKIEACINSFSEANRNVFHRLFDEDGVPLFLSVCPLSNSEGLLGAAMFFMYNISEQERSEWERLLTLASGLYSLRLAMTKLYMAQQPKTVYHTSRSRDAGEIINKLNNHLNAIIGNADLANLSEDISGETKNHFQSIINEAEKAAEYLKNTNLEFKRESKDISAKKVDETLINDIIGDVLDKSFISENIYMVGGRPREINKSFGSISGLEFGDQKIKNLFEEAINRFATITDDEDVISISTYSKGSFVYLDISRHHKNFPAVQQVSEFGDYQLSEDVLKYRPVDTFLRNISDDNCYYSYDRHSSNPSYLSFKFPAKEEPVSSSEIARSPRILAIDDQTVILDLISAMAQTSGYRVDTAISAEEGLLMALKEPFDIILTDLSMPGLSGLELARELRRNGLTIPIVLLTGWEANLDSSQLKAMGITKVLYKPFRIEQLTDIIESLAGKPQNLR